MSDRRILQVITRSDWGGAPRIVESLATRIDGVTDVACGPGGRLIDRLEDAGITVHVQPHLQSSPHPKDLLAYRDIRTLVADGEFDLVHSHSTKAGALARIAAARANIPSVFTVHGWGFYNADYGAIRPLVIKGERFLASRTDEIVCVSRNDYEQGRTYDILSDEVGTVIHNGISPPGIPADRNTLQGTFGIDPKTPVIGAIARLATQKNPLAILKTAKRIEDRGHDIATVLIGSGPLAEECQRFVDHNNLTNVYFPGFRDDVLELLPDFDVFVLPSKFEGFPLTVLECMHVGVPIVAHDVGGVAEAINDGETGFIDPPEAADDRFTDRVEALLENPKRRQRMGCRARQVAATRFTAERMVGEYRNLYEQIL
jgi:glycosyltransferase involved in cell wall biosynthesis